MRRIAPAIVLLSILAPASSAASADTRNGPEPPAVLLARTATGDVRLPAVSTRVAVDVSGAVVRTTVEQTYENRFDHPIEVRYVHPLAHDAAVDRFELQVGERRIVGKIRRRSEARETYEQAAAAGHVASLLEQDRPNVFRQDVANIPPGEPVVVRVGTVAVLAPIGGSYELRHPVVVAPRYDPAGRTEVASEPPGTFEIEVRLDTALPIVSVGSPTHDVTTERTAPGSARIDLADGRVAADRDFVLRWDVFGAEPEAGWLAHRTGVDGTLSLIVHPGERGDAPRPPRRFVFLVDVSGSMEGAGLETARRFLDAALRRLGPDDELAVLDFADDVRRWRGTVEPVSDDALSDARRWIAKRVTRGGTDLGRGLEAALGFARDSDREVAVVVVTDALVGADEEVVRLARLHPGVRFFPIGVGLSPNDDLRTRLARVGGGATLAVAGPEDVHTAVDRFDGWCAGPAISDLQIDWGALPVGDVEPSVPIHWYGDDPLVLVARYWGGAASGSITIRGFVDGVPWEKRIDVDLPERREAHGALASVWARKRIERLHDEHGYDPPEPVRDEITELALEHRLMSRYTSFVAVDRSRVVTPQIVEAHHEFAETVVVQSAAPLIASSKTFVMTDEFIQDLPVPGRFYSGVLTLAPGVGDDAGGTGAVTVHGSRNRDFQVSVGGIAQVDPLRGRPLGFLQANGIEGMEIVTSGAGLEHGRTQGGFARIIQKQGSNDVEAGVEVTLGGSALEAGGNTDAPSYDTAVVGAEVSGPVVRDRLWYAMTAESVDGDRLADTTRTLEVVDVDSGRASMSLTWQASPRNKVEVRLAGSDEERIGVGVNRLTPRASALRVEDRSRGAAVVWSVPWSAMSYFESRLETTRRTHRSDPLETPTSASCGGSPLPRGARCWDAIDGTFRGSDPFRFDDEVRTAGASSTGTFHLASRYRVRAGLAVHRETWSRRTRRAPDLFRLANDGESILVGRFGFEAPRSEATSTSWSARSEGEIELASTWTLTFGLRFDRERLDVPGGAEAAAWPGATPAFQVARDVWSPRLALDWDAGGDGRTSVELRARRLHGALPAVLGVIPAEPAAVDRVVDAGDLSRAPGTMPTVVQTIDPGLEVPYVDEGSLAVAREIAAETVLRLTRLERRARRQLGLRAADEGLLGLPSDVAVYVLDGSESYDHEAWILSLVRRQYRGWRASASYTWSRTRGTSDPFDPLAGDLRTLTEPVPGYHSSDRRHRFEALVSSTTPWGFRLSGRIRWRSGSPYSVVRTVVEPLDGDRVRIAWVLPEGRNTRRGPSQWLADLRWTKELRVGQGAAVRMYVDVFNLLDDRTVAVHDPWTGRGRSLDGFRETVGETGRRFMVGVAWSM